MREVYVVNACESFISKKKLWEFLTYFLISATTSPAGSPAGSPSGSPKSSVTNYFILCSIACNIIMILTNTTTFGIKKFNTFD